MTASGCERMMTDAAPALPAGEGCARGDALRWLDAGTPLEPLLERARAVRDRRGRIITYSRKVFLPLTNLCRDHCGYCTFRRNPGDPDAAFLAPADILAVANAGAAAGCSEALFSLGDAPELVFPEARARLAALGFTRTMEYLVEACRLVLDQTPLFPHSNPGLMGEADLAALKPVNASLGVMLESTSERLLEAGGPHYGSHTKLPSKRLAVLEAAGRLKIPFTTGLLIGIGETPAERVDALLAIRDLQERYGHIQEVIIQNFRPKRGIPMADHPEPSLEQMLRTVAAARLVFGSEMNIQAPPNLTRDFGRLLDAGINDWGGISPVTADCINPDDPWPDLERLRSVTARRGFLLRQRLPVYPEFILDRPEFLPPSLQARMRQGVGADGLVPEA
jgi:7,8-didemethyl-8-hydroxy-5-deazariboflavin synthase CofG subunit